MDTLKEAFIINDLFHIYSTTSYHMHDYTSPTLKVKCASSARMVTPELRSA